MFVKHDKMNFQTESLLLVQPLIGVLTKSELHAVMTAGFATVAGALTASYVMLGVSISLDS
jgi:nucleoside permease NupC